MVVVATFLPSSIASKAACTALMWASSACSYGFSGHSLVSIRGLVKASNHQMGGGQIWGSASYHLQQAEGWFMMACVTRVTGSGETRAHFVAVSGDVHTSWCTLAVQSKFSK